MAKRKAKKVRSPFAVCRAMQKEHGWGEAKYERCVKQVKGRQKQLKGK